ncbi:hypothetical protein QYE76_055493 [Lolium multiflorum]|uniref:Uncharacterized protein n=1 Tax=Lolium multiflorum TaxID=4521 RepID=A0AAD8T0V4_LOLMU|nr:hypothetical protein QYE76_055493 [Lolium multiflorum]
MAALTSDLQGVKVQIGQDLDVVRTTLSTEVANLTAAIAGIPRPDPTALAQDPSTSRARESDGTTAGLDGHRWTHNSRGMALGTTMPPPGGAAVNVVVTAPKTMKLQVSIQDQQFLFLVDSGNSTCFIDTQKAKELTGAQFKDDFKVLDLGSYDGIIGLDWLAKY